jgi:hypothetical protein
LVHAAQGLQANRVHEPAVIANAPACPGPQGVLALGVIEIAQDLTKDIPAQ